MSNNDYCGNVGNFDYTETITNRAVSMMSDNTANTALRLLVQVAVMES